MLGEGQTSEWLRFSLFVSNLRNIESSRLQKTEESTTVLPSDLSLAGIEWQLSDFVAIRHFVLLFYLKSTRLFRRGKKDFLFFFLSRSSCENGCTACLEADWLATWGQRDQVLNTTLTYQRFSRYMVNVAANSYFFSSQRHRSSFGVGFCLSCVQYSLSSALPEGNM